MLETYRVNNSNFKVFWRDCQSQSLFFQLKLTFSNCLSRNARANSLLSIREEYATSSGQVPRRLGRAVYVQIKNKSIKVNVNQKYHDESDKLRFKHSKFLRWDKVRVYGAKISYNRNCSCVVYSKTAMLQNDR